MATTEIKTAIESQQARGISRIDPVSIPGFGIPNNQGGFDPSKHSVHYAKIDLDDLGSITTLEILETRALRNEGVFILTKDRYIFMDKCFMIVSYLERDIPSSKGVK